MAERESRHDHAGDERTPMDAHTPQPAGLPPEEQAQKAVAKKPPPGARKRKQGLVIVNTGHGKGKSTAAFGLMTRAWGRGMRVCVIQFIKHANAKFGEHRAAKKMGIEMLAMGDGFTWVARDLDESAARGRHGWALAQAKIASGDYDLVILDEFTYTFK
ncbi:MAG: cob(I)yrinic acid a,c-diamide adenosyltransferase [Chloroflexota bacterium]|nr:cob(I)yrinic acid a,c-diamide adenosyltransferase [Chloroflexota bacterium]